VDLSSSTLVVVDPQVGFVNSKSEHVLPRLVELVGTWFAAGGDVVFSRYHNYPASPFERLLNWTDVHDSPETDIVPALAGLAGDARAVITKTGYTVLNAHGEQVVAEHGWTDLIFCGLDTDTCVLKSAVDAFERGLTPWLVTDACASHSGRAEHEMGLTMAGRFIGAGQLLTTQDLLAKAIMGTDQEE
jgi:nicotinamidase-related amidase